MMPVATEKKQQDKKKVFFPNLDGLRFFAFLAVFFAHSFYSEKPGSFSYIYPSMGKGIKYIWHLWSQFFLCIKWFSNYLPALS